MGLPPFRSFESFETPLADGIELESQWMTECASTGEPKAFFWEGVPGLVVPRSYLQHGGFEAACTIYETAGTPVQVRKSGGGLVPQGPGILNLSLVWTAGPTAALDPHSIYSAFSHALALGFAELGLTASAQTVEGSFCDGRYNLAISNRKVVGTAQSWRWIGGKLVVLAHAVLMVDADLVLLTEIANGFEQAVGTSRRYRTDALTSVAQELGDVDAQGPPSLTLQQICRSAIARQLRLGQC